MRLKRFLALVVSLAMVLTMMPAGLVVSANESGVAMIGDKAYTSLADAVNAANAGDTVVLYQDVEKLPAISKAITIDGNGRSVAQAYGEGQFGTIDGTVTLKNLVFTNGNEAIRTDYLSADYSNLTLVIDNCTFNNLTTYAIMGGKSDPQNHLHKELVVKKSTFNAGATASSNYMVYAQCVGTLTVEDCVFNGGNTTKGAIHTGDSTAKATVATISGNTISGVARGVQIGNRVVGSSVAVDDNTFKNVTTAADSKSGAIYVHGNADENVAVSVTDNEATSCTNVMYNDGNVLSDIVTTYEGNTKEGVAIYIDSEGKDTTEAPTLDTAYISAGYINGVPAVYGEATGVVGTESFVVKLYSGKTLVGTAALVDNDKVLLNGKSQTITWHAALADDGDGWWKTEWTNALNINTIPDKAELLVDGVKVSEYAVQLNINDLKNPIFAAVTDGNGNIQSFVAGTGYLNGTGANAPVYDDAFKAALNAGGNIVLLRDVTLTGAVDGTDANIDLNGKTLKLTTTGSRFKGNSTIKNGTIDISDGTVAKGTTSYLTVVAGNTLTLDKITLTGKDYASEWAVLCAMGNTTQRGTLNLTNSTVTLENDLGTNGGFVKDTSGNNNQATINIENTKITLTNVDRGFTGGKLNLEDVELTITGGEHGINGAELTAVDSTISISDGTGRALTVNKFDVKFENSSLTASNMGEGEIRFKTANAITADATSNISECSAHADVAGANINGTAVTGTEDEPSTVKVVNGVVTIKMPVSGTITSCLVDISDPAETFIASEIKGLKATESVVIKLYSGETQIATTTLKKPEYYVMETLGVKIIITGESSSWETVWAEGMPRADVIPDKVVLYVDGQEMNSANVPMTSTNGELAVNWAEVPGVKTVPAGTLNVAYISAGYINGVSAIYGDATGVVGTESFVVKLYSGETHVGTAALVDNDKVLLNGVSKDITWHAALANDGDSWWETEWTNGALNINAIPDKAELWVDGVKVDECDDVQLNGPDLKEPIFAAVTDAADKVTSFVAGTGFLNGTGEKAPAYDEALKTALKAGGNITLLCDVTLTKTVKVSSAADLTFNGNGKTISGNGALWFENSSVSHKINNVVFDNITTDGSANYGVLEFVNVQANVIGCTFTNNNAPSCIAVDANASTGTSKVTIDGCIFTGNNCSTSVINSAAGSTIVQNSDITGNAAKTAVIYNSANLTATGNVFSGNSVEDNKQAVILTGPYAAGEYEVSITENAFMDDNYVAVYVENWADEYNAVSTNDLSGNYWYDGHEPVNGTDYFAEEDANVTLENYYTKYENGTLDGLENVVTGPEGSLNIAYTSAGYINGVPAVYGEATGVVGTESFVVKLYSGETLVGTAALVDTQKVLLNGKSQTITWHAALADDGDSWWSTTWENGALNINAIPDKAELWVDSVKVDECEVKLSGADGFNPLIAAVSNENGNVTSFVQAGGWADKNIEFGTALADAIEAATSGQTVTLLRDVTLTKAIRIKAGQKVTLDLAGYTVDFDPEVWVYGSANSGTSLIMVQYGGDLTIKDSSEEQTGLLDGSLNGSDVYDAVTLTQKGDNAENGVAKLTVNGGTLKGYYYGISGQGSRDGTEITINGGYITAADGGAGIYHPQNGTLTITGGTLEGDVAVYIKSGSLEITGGTLIGNGEKKDYTFNGSGANVTGDALVIENVGGTSGYEAIGTVSITGGTFTSENAFAVGSYAATVTNPDAEAVTGFISGGTFSSDVTELCADGFVATPNADGTFGVTDKIIMVTYKDGSVEYFSDMLDAVPYTTNYPKLEGATITLLGNVSGKGMRFMENDMVFDLNGFTFTITDGTGSQGTNTSGFQIRPEVTTDVLFKNGTINVTNAPVAWMFNSYATDFIVENVIVDCAGMAYDTYGESCYVAVSREGDNIQLTGTTEIINFNSNVAGDAYSIGGTMTVADTVTVGGTIQLDAGASLTAGEGLDVVAAEGCKLVYENGVYTAVAVNYVAQIDDVQYESLAEALNAAEAGDTVTLLTDVADTGVISVKTGVTLDGNGKTISGNSCVYMATSGESVVKNVNFKDIHNDNNKLSAIYATGLEADAIVTIKDNTFDNVDWDAIQATSAMDGAKVTITGNTFTNTDDTPAYRYVHVQPTTGCKMNLTVTDNKMYTDNKVAAAMGIYYIGDEAAINLSGNYVDDHSKVSIILNDETDGNYNGAEAVLPFVEEDMVTEVNYAVVVSKANLWQANFYANVADAIKAAEAGDTVTIFAGNYAETLSVNKSGITVVGETDEEGNNLVTFEKLSVSGSDITVKNINAVNTSANAGVVSGGNIVIENCEVTGSNGFRYCYANNGDVTFKNCVITGSTYGVHFDAGSGEGNVIIDGCTITGWTSFGSAIEGVTISNTTFADGNYDQLRFYQDVTLENVTFNPEMTIDFGKADVTADFTDCSVTDGSALTDVIYIADIAEMGIEVTVDGEPIVVEASVTTGEDTAYYLTLEEAITAAADGDTVTLLADVELTESVVLNAEGTITIDGNGYSVKQAEGYKDTQNGLFMLGGTGSAWNSDSVANHNYTIKNVVFDGIEGWSAIRAQGVALTVDGCEFVDGNYNENCFSIIRVDHTETVVKNTTVKNNTAPMGIAHNWNCGSLTTKLTVDECVFESNTFNSTAAIYYVKGAGCEITNSEFVGNNVTPTGNGATLYLGFQENCTVTGNLFKDNVVTATSDSDRVAGAIMIGYEAKISGNAFVNNTATNANNDVLGQDVCASTYYTGIDLSDNYFNGEKPVDGDRYYMEYGTYPVTIDSYYTEYSLDENGNVVLGELVEIKTPAGDVTYGGYVGTSGEAGTASYRENMQVDIYGVYAENSLVVELWNGETQLSTTTLRETDRDDDTSVIARPIEGDITANIVVKGRLAGSWNTEWHVDPAAYALPETIKVYADGELVDTWTEGFTTDAEKAEYISLTGVDKGEATVTDAEGNVEYFKTLAEAVDAATNGETVTLLSNVEVNDVLTVADGREVTVDLAGYTISAGEDFARTSWGIFAVERGADLTIEDRSTEGTGVVDSNDVYAAVMMTTNADTNTEGTAKLTVNGGTLIGNYYAVTGNGSRNNTEIIINDGTLKGTNTTVSLGIFNPQNGTVTIAGGTIEGTVGIEMRSGTLTMTGGTVKSVYNGELKTVASDSGSTVFGGAAVVLSQHTTNNPIAINITGGILDGEYAFYQDRLINTYAPSVNISATIGAGVTVDGNVVANEDGYEMVYDATTGWTLEQVDYVAQVGETKYTSVQAAVDAAVDGDVITVIADVEGEAVTVDKSVTITGDVTLTDVSITGSGSDVELTVSELKFTGASYINANNAAALTVTGVDANVTLNSEFGSIINSRAAFIMLGRENQHGLVLTVTNNNIVVKGNNSPDPILGWSYIADGSVISNNTFGSEEAPNWDAVKILNFADGATLTMEKNTVYANGNGFAFGQNTSKNNAYTVVLDGNKFMTACDYVWVEVTDATTTHATVKATSANTVNGTAFTVADIKTSVANWTSYAGVDVVTNAEGKLIGGTFTKLSNKSLVAEGYAAVNNADGTWTVVKQDVAKIGETTYATVQDAIDAIVNGETEDNYTIELLSDVNEEVVTDEESLTRVIITNGTNAYTLSGTLTLNGGAIVTIEADAKGVLEVNNDTTTSEIEGAERYGYSTLDSGVAMMNGAQIRYGSGVNEETGAVNSANGIRFIATVSRVDTLVSFADTVENIKNIGIEIGAEDSDLNIDVKASKYQNENQTIFTAALTNLEVSNYNRMFNAKAYVVVDGVKYVNNDETANRSIYQVSVGLLKSGDDKVNEDSDYTMNAALEEVLQAYVNHVGIRLTYDFTTKAVTVRENTASGAYTGDIFFAVESTPLNDGTSGVKVTVKPYTTTTEGDNKFNNPVVISEKLWKSYIRINNNNGVIKNRVVFVSNDTETGEFVFNFYPNGDMPATGTETVTE